MTSQALQDKGFQIQNRPAFNILYLAFNQANPALKDVKVRQALNYAIDKEALLKASLPPGSKAAIQFMPDLVNGYNPNVTTYDYDAAEGQVPAQGGGPGEPDAEVRLPDRRLAAVHADAGGHVPGAQEPARGGRHHDHPGERPVEPGLPGHGADRGGLEEAGHPPAGLDR